MLTRAHAITTVPRIVVAALLTLGLLIPTPVLAAKGNQTRIEVNASALLEQVSPGASVAFSASIVNKGPGTITSLQFTGSAPGATFERASTPCTGSGSTVSCVLGKFDAGASHFLTFVFTAPGTGAVAFSGQFSGDAQSGNPKSNSTDVWPVSAPGVGVNASPGFFGTWQAAHNALLTFTPITTGTQQSRVTAHPVGNDYPVLLVQGAGDIGCAPEDLGEGFGDVLDLSVAQGGTPVDIRIDYAPGAVDKPANKVSLIHERDNGTCVPVPKCDGSNAGNCFTAFYEGTGRSRHLVILASLPQNGRVKGY